MGSQENMNLCVSVEGDENYEFISSNKDKMEYEPSLKGEWREYDLWWAKFKFYFLSIYSVWVYVLPFYIRKCREKSKF